MTRLQMKSEIKRLQDELEEMAALAKMGKHGLKREAQYCWDIAKAFAYSPEVIDAMKVACDQYERIERVRKARAENEGGIERIAADTELRKWCIDQACTLDCVRSGEHTARAVAASIYEFVTSEAPEPQTNK